MGITGAVLYSLALISARELARFPSRANRTLRRAFHALIGGVAHYRASLCAMPHGKSSQLVNER